MSVRFDHVSKRFGALEALIDFTLDVDDGEFLVLLGPSGCGKTTALRILAGLDEPTTGDVLIDGRVVTELPPHNRDIAMVFQNYALYPHMNVFDNMAFGLRARKVPRREIDSLVHDAARLLGIDDLLKKRPGQLSGGQRQRVALGRAIVRRPRAFLMDEPLSNLDAKLRAQTRVELIRLHRRLASTVLYVTHDQTEAMTMGRRIAVLDRGRLQQVGTPRDIYERPDNRFVAEFVGIPSMSFFSSAIRAAPGGCAMASTSGIDFRLSPREIVLAQSHGLEQVLVGVRPEHFELMAPEAEALKAPIAAEFSASVDVIESLGNEIHATLLVGDRAVIARLPADETIVPGESCRFVVKSDRLMLFDPATGTRLK